VVNGQSLCNQLLWMQSSFSLSAEDRVLQKYPFYFDASICEIFGPLLAGAKLEIVGGTSLFRLARTPAAGAWFDHLGRAGILVRRFAEAPAWLRFGLPGIEKAWQRLATALAGFDERWPGGLGSRYAAGG